MKKWKKATLIVFGVMVFLVGIYIYSGFLYAGAYNEGQDDAYSNISGYWMNWTLRRVEENCLHFAENELNYSLRELTPYLFCERVLYYNSSKTYD